MATQAKKRERRETRGGTAQSTPRSPGASALPATATRRSMANRKKPARAPAAKSARYLPPPVAPCDDLMGLFALDLVAARDHVDAELHAAMPAAQADAFEARGYRWELHLVALDQICLLRTVDLVPSRVRRYRAALRRGASCAPLIGLGGEGKSPAEDVLLCDGYHRAVALRDAGIHFAWVWLAVDAW